MSIVVAGEGVAGLLTANLLAEDGHQVTLVGSGASNSSIAGQRYRTGADSLPDNPDAMFSAIVGSATGKVDPSRVSELVKGTIKGVSWMQKLGVPVVSNKDWFGPQLGVYDLNSKKSPGINVINVLKALACSNENIQIMRGRILTIEEREVGARQKRVATALSGSELYELSFNHLVLATGTPTGVAFESTNRAIRGSALSMALSGCIGAGAELYDIKGVDDVMVHPFGRISPKGNVVGCFATDPIADSPIYVDGERDGFVEAALREHVAHSKFTEISKRLFGKECRLGSADGEPFAPSVHYWHAGIAPVEDAVMVEDGLFVAGDAGGTSRYFPGQRLPGTALSMCLADAMAVRAHLGATSAVEKVGYNYVGASESPCMQRVGDNDKLLRLVNTEKALGLMTDLEHRNRVASLADGSEVGLLSCLYSGDPI